MNTPFLDLPPIAKAAYILDHGWYLAEHQQDGNHQYATRERPFMQPKDLETAYAMQKSYEDQFGKAMVT